MSDGGRSVSRNASADGAKGDDALAVLGWGVRHYAWILLVGVCAFGVLVPYYLQRAPESFEAQAQVGPAEPLNLQNIDPLPRLGDSLFRNGSVAEAVRQSFDPPLPRSEDVIPQRVDLVTAQDNVVLTVVGRGSTPELAAGLANVAAKTLVVELNRYQGAVGSFTIQRRAEPPGRPVARIGEPQAVGIGVLAGLTIALGCIGLLLIRRRPVLSVGSAESATGALVLGRVWLGRSPQEARGLPQLCHTILAFDCEELLLSGTRDTRRVRRELRRLLANVLAGRRDVITSQQADVKRSRPRQPGGRPSGIPELVVITDASQSQLVTRTEQSVAMLVVREGISRASLVRQVEQYLDGGAAGILLVRGARWSPRSLVRSRRAKPRPSTAEAWPAVLDKDASNGAGSTRFASASNQARSEGNS